MPGNNQANDFPHLINGPLFRLHISANVSYTVTHEDRWANASSRHLGADPALGSAPGQGRRESEQRDEELWTLSDHDLPLAASGEARRRESVASAQAHGA